ncbi:MAG: 30S ribosomal protein S17 [Thermoplasmatota archaeon]
MIGVDVKEPERECTDRNCPFHGTLPVRGVALTGTVVSTAMDKTVVIQKRRMHRVPKYQRYEKRTSRYKAHLPGCIDVEKGDDVTIMECRPLSKTVSFVVVEKK